jgi:hypothetical protein
MRTSMFRKYNELALVSCSMLAERDIPVLHTEGDESVTIDIVSSRHIKVPVAKTPQIVAT